MATKIQLRRDTAENWAATNPVLSQGEAGYDLTNNILKVGNGLTQWNSLQGITGSNGEGNQGAQGIQGIQGTQSEQGIQGIQGASGTADSRLPIGEQEGYLYNDGDGDLFWRGPIFPNNSSIQGFLYNNGNGNLQWSLDTGLQGIQGLQGLQGPSDGAQGVQGVQGLQGPSDGAQGAQGIQGVSGASDRWPVGEQEGYLYNDGDGDLYWRGPLFPDNSNVQGFLYNSGNGTLTWQEGGGAGTQGIQGIQGGSGMQGIQGTAGEPGMQGIQGTAGEPGMQGIQGISGATVTPLGRTFYVSKNGNDENNDGLTSGTAFLTIKHALTQMLSGETLLIASGTYTERYPLTAPANITIHGAGIRATTIQPTFDTDTKDGWEIFGSTTFTDFTMRGQYWNDNEQTGYAFRIRPGANWSERSPYIQRVTILNKGRNPSLPDDPYGFTVTGDGNTAGRGIFIDGKDVSASSTQAAILLNEVTMFVPNSIGLYMRNGARCEALTTFVYFADKAVLLEEGVEGINGDGKTKLRVSGITGGYTPTAGDRLVTYDAGSTQLDLTIESYDVATSQIIIDGKINGLVEGLNDLTFFSGEVEQATANAITFVDYKDFGAELRAISSAFVYGNYGVYADGDGIQANMIAHNFAYIGSGGDSSNDDALAIQANEVVSLNGARVYVSSVDHTGEFRIGNSQAPWSFEDTGALTTGGSWTKTTNNNLISGVAAQTVWRSTQTYISGAKLMIQVECDEDGDATGWHTQTCEAVIAARGSNTTTEPEMVVYGVIHTSVAPLMTFTTQRNPTTQLIEIIGTRTVTASPSGNASLRIYSVETGTMD
jgi:hypothetical protein